MSRQKHESLIPCAMIVAVLAGLSPPQAGATDLRPRLRPEFRYVYTDEAVLPEVYVDNINILTADSYRTHFVIYGPLLDVVYADTVDRTDLPAFSTDTVRASLSWSPGLTGLYCLTVRVEFSQDIDNSNNSLLQDVDVLMGRTTARWMVGNRIHEIFPDTANTWVWMQCLPLMAGDTLASFDRREFSTRLDRPTWFAWADYGKSKYFAHPGAFGLIDAYDSTFTWHHTSWWPLVNGLYPAGFDLDSLNHLIFGTPEVEALIPNPTTLQDSSAAIAGDSVCALLVSGAIKEPNDSSFIVDLDFMEKNLRYEPLGPRLTSVIRLPDASRQQIFTQLDSMAGKYRKIYFYYSGHGGLVRLVTNDTTYDDRPLYEDLLRRLSGTRADSVILIVDACYSGAAIRAFRAYRDEFSFKHLTIIASSNEDSTSYVRPIRTGTGQYIRPGMFTWFYLLCYGDPSAETDGVPGISEAEAFHWTRAQDPLFNDGKRRMNKEMDPQLFVYEQKEAETAATAFPAADVLLEETSPHDTSLTFTVEMNWGHSKLDFIDTNVVYVSPGRYWNISMNTFATDVRLNLGIRYRFETDSITSVGDLGLVHRNDSTERWKVYPKISLDTLRKMVTAIDVEGFSDWALAVVRAGSVTGVEENPGEAPVTFRLFQNYPNPFNPATTIQFMVPQAGPVSLVLYDLLGRQVRTILRGEVAAGSHRVLLQADGLASGTYIYRLNGAGSVALRKMIILK